MTQKFLPGRLAVSCLTCRKRHKKCDLRQPVCARCEKGSFHCLGYDFNQRKVASSERPRRKPKTPKTQTRPDGDTTTTQVDAQLNLDNEGDGEELHPGVRGDLAYFPNSDPCSSELSSTSDSDLRITSDEDGGVLTTTNQSSIISRSKRPAATNSSPSLQQLFSLFTRICLSPSDPTLSYLNSPDLDGYIMTNFVQMVNCLYFRATGNQKTRIISTAIFRLRTSQLSRWVKLLTTKVVEALVGADAAKYQFYNQWIEDIEAGIKAVLSQYPNRHDARVLRGDWLEVAVLKSVLVHSSIAYQILRSVAYTFIQAIYSSPDIQSVNSNPSAIPLRNLLISDHLDLASFTLSDSIFAMAFGLPHLVEYDTSGGPLPNHFLLQEWAQNVPVEFQLLLTDINNCRDSRPGALDWWEIERRLITWQSRIVGQDKAWESWMTVAWLAVQESWRLTLLVYLYMAVCGSYSDDLRIQRCVSQLLQVVSTVKDSQLTGVKVPFFIQYLIAGICATSEKHRAIVRDKMLDKSETRFWKVRGADFVPVLDYLWHEIGSAGRPITWYDYVRSREAMLPVVICQ